MKDKLKTTIVSAELACIVSLIALSGLGISSLGTVGFVQQMGLAVGMTAGVPKNEYNTLAQALKERDVAITEREKALAEKEANILQEQRVNDTKLSYLVISIGALLLSLILLNFYLDARRKRNEGYVVNIKK